MEILVNKCYGGFGVSVEAQHLYAKKKGFTLREEKTKWGSVELYKDGAFFYPDWDRFDPVLLEVFHELGTERFSGDCASVEITEIPDGTSYNIEEYDGQEWISETHQTW